MSTIRGIISMHRHSSSAAHMRMISSRSGSAGVGYLIIISARDLDIADQGILHQYSIDCFYPMYIISFSLFLYIYT